jgi:hypothetical protein
MKVKQSLMAGLVGIAAMIAMPLAASAGGYYPGNYQNTRWQASGALVPVGHYYGWRNHANYNSNLICDEDGDNRYSAARPDENDQDYEPYAGYQDQYRAPSYRDRAYNNYSYNSGYGRPYNNNGYNSYDYNSGYNRAYGAPAYNNYGYNQGYGGAYNAPYDNNGAYGNGANGGLSTLIPLLQQFVH